MGKINTKYLKDELIPNMVDSWLYILDEALSGIDDLTGNAWKRKSKSKCADGNIKRVFEYKRNHRLKEKAYINIITDENDDKVISSEIGYGNFFMFYEEDDTKWKFSSLRRNILPLIVKNGFNEIKDGFDPPLKESYLKKLLEIKSWVPYGKLYFKDENERIFDFVPLEGELRVYITTDKSDRVIKHTSIECE